MHDFTFQQLLSFDSVISEGSFQAAAAKIGRSHPTVFSAVKKLETQLGFKLLNRSGYRVCLTDEGRSFHDAARGLLDGLRDLQRRASEIEMGEESALTVVVGDLCPLAATLALLKRFGNESPRTRLHLRFETLGGPLERLLDNDADLAIHYLEAPNPRIETIDLQRIELLPVVAPGFLKFPVSRVITPDQMRDYVQCVIRDTARHSQEHSYYLIENARSWTVSDQLMKKEVILQGMGWGHMPLWLVDAELRKGSLTSIAGRHFHKVEVPLAVMRRRDRARGPVATRLWDFIAGALRPSARRRRRVKR